MSIIVLLIKTLVPVFFCITILACSTTQEGRSRILLFDDQKLSTMGAQAFNQLKQEEKLSQDKYKRQYLRCIAEPIIKALDQDNDPDKWEIRLFASDQANAFALPGRKIGVYEGLLKYAVNQHQLAAVIGHELAHVTAEHGNERVSSSALSQVGLSLLGLQSSLAANLLLQYGFTLPYGRSHETEADLIGLLYMAKAGFDPRESVLLWKNMAEGGKEVPEFLSTHPSPQNRIKQLEQRIPDVLPYYQRAVAEGRNPNCYETF